MKLDIARMDVWVAGIEDCPGGLAEVLNGLAAAGANLEFGIARRSPEGPEEAVVFAAPITGARQAKAAKQLGFQKSKSVHGVRVIGADKPGLGLTLTEALAVAGLNLRGFSGVTVGKRAAFHFAFDTAANAAKAVRVLQKL